MTTQAEKYSVVGLRDVHTALVTQDDADGFAADTPVAFAPAISAAQAPATNAKTQYADDGQFDTMSSEGETKIDIEVTAIPLEILATVLGRVYDASTGRMFDNGGTPPLMALSFRSQKSNGSYKYYQYLKGRFSAPSEENATKTDAPDPKPAKITFTALKTVYQFDLGSVNDGVKRVVGDEDASGFNGATWFDAVQVPVAGSPSALTCTPSPTDGATGQTTTVAITLTFNNAIKSYGELGISLTRVDTGAAVAVTKTWNAARTVLTLAHSALVSTKQYYINVNGVKDIYGQSLSDAVYKFTIA